MSRSLHPDHAKRDPRNVPDWRKLLTRRDERRAARRTAPRNAARGFITPHALLFALALLFVLAALPALYFGMVFAVWLGYFPAFPVPAFLCVVVACICTRCAENAEVARYRF